MGEIAKKSLVAKKAVKKKAVKKKAVKKKAVKKKAVKKKVVEKSEIVKVKKNLIKAKDLIESAEILDRLSSLKGISTCCFYTRNSSAYIGNIEAAKIIVKILRKHLPDEIEAMSAKARKLLEESATK